jgi:hypothetical protein
LGGADSTSRMAVAQGGGGGEARAAVAEEEGGEEAWLLASRPDRASCLTDERGREFFPHLLLICSVDSGRMLGMGSCPELSVSELRRVIEETAGAPADGAPRRPAEVWLQAVSGPLRCRIS